MYARITLDHDPANSLYFVELAIPTFNDTPQTHLAVFEYGPTAEYQTAILALQAAEKYADAANDMARLMGKGAVDRDAAGYLRRAKIAREIDAQEAV